MVKLWGLTLMFTAAAVVVLRMMLSLKVVGPLLGGGQQLADMEEAETSSAKATIGQHASKTLVSARDGLIDRPARRRRDSPFAGVAAAVRSCASVNPETHSKATATAGCARRLSWTGAGRL